jgi:MerR family redox-sensitive transcriptional activator SoxR
MSELTISEVARRVGLRPSAIRYYERLGILPPTRRKSGQRRYDETVVFRLAVINQARQVGFSLIEVRDLFFGFGRHTTAGNRWKVMSRQKLAELDQAVEQILAMKELLHRLENCGCDALDECGRKMIEKCCSDTNGVATPVIKNRKVAKRSRRAPVTALAARRFAHVLPTTPPESHRR